MLYQIYFFTVVSFVLAICACVYMLVLSHENVLNWWFRFGSRFETTKKGSQNMIHKVIWGCEKCLSGQLALWTYLIVVYKPFSGYFKPSFDLGGYNLLIHLYFICISVLMARIISKLFSKYNI